MSEIINAFDELTVRNPAYRYETTFTGKLAFEKSSAEYYFESQSDIVEALAGEAIDDIEHWFLRYAVQEREKKESQKFHSERVVYVELTGFSYRSYLGIQVSSDDFSRAKQQIEAVRQILGCEYIKTASDEDSLLERRQNVVKESVEILQNLEYYQTRIKEPFRDEKAVQDFIYPILKSHFLDLQEEDTVSKFSGGFSKPDFNILRLGIAYEIKVTSASLKFAKLADQILIDLGRYVNKNTSYKTMIVLIYNISSEPIPANFIEDLESHEAIAKVIISPRVIPKSQT